MENRLHWILGVSFGEDGSVIRKDNAPQNLSLVKTIVLNMIRLDTTHKTKASAKQLLGMTISGLTSWDCQRDDSRVWEPWL